MTRHAERHVRSAEPRTPLTQREPSTTATPAKAGRGAARDLDAGSLQPIFDSFELYLLAERKSPKTLPRTCVRHARRGPASGSSSSLARLPLAHRRARGEW